MWSRHVFVRLTSILSFLIASVTPHFMRINMRYHISASKVHLHVFNFINEPEASSSQSWQNSLRLCLWSFLITHDSGAMFSTQSAVSSNQTRNIKGFTPGNKYMHSLEAKEHPLFQMNTVLIMWMFRGTRINRRSEIMDCVSRDPQIHFFYQRLF